MVILVFVKDYNLKFPTYQLNKQKYIDKFEPSHKYFNMYQFLYDTHMLLSDAIRKTIYLNSLRKNNNFICIYHKNANKK